MIQVTKNKQIHMKFFYLALGIVCFPIKQLNQRTTQLPYTVVCLFVSKATQTANSQANSSPLTKTPNLSSKRL